MMDIRQRIMLEELYNAGDYAFILENYDVKSLLKKYSYTDGCILLDKIKEKMDTVSFLKSLGSKIEDLDIVIFLEKYGHHFVVNESPLFSKFNRENVSALFEQEEFNFDDYDQSLIDEMYALFGRNDNYNILLFLEKVFYESLEVDEEMARRDFSLLLDIKRDNPDFDIVIGSKNGSSFSKNIGGFGNIVLKDENVLAFNHEFVHVLAKYKSLKVGYLPKCDDEGKNIAVSKINQVAKENMLDESFAKQKYEEYILQSDNIDDYKIKIEEEFKDLFGSKELLQNVLSSMKRPKDLLLYVYAAYHNKRKYLGSLDDQKYMIDYINYYLNVEYEQFKRNLYQVMYGEFLIFQNFVDAYLNGSLYDYYIHHNYHKGVYAVSVHTENYFLDNPNVRFFEMLADYVALKKSSKGQVLINYLKEIVGEEFIQFLDDYYFNLEDYKFDNEHNNKKM